MELNEAILRLLTVQFKYQLKNGEDKIVKEHGYIVDKQGGCFRVGVPRDNGYRTRYVYIGESYSGRQKVITWNGYRERVYIFDNVEDAKKFDFVGFLNKPINAEYIEVAFPQNTYYGVTETQRKMNRLEQKKRFVKYREDEINKIKAQIAKLQNDLEGAIRGKIREEDELETVKRELGLKK